MPAEIGGGYDSHTHLIPPVLIEQARSGGFDLEISDEHLIAPAARIPLRQIGSPDFLDHWISEQSLDGAIVSAPPPLFGIRRDEPERWASHLNDTMLATCTARLRPLAFLPIYSPQASKSLLDQIDNEFVGAVVGTNFGESLPSDQVYDDVWERLTAKGLPLFVHPEASHDKRLEPFYLANLVGNPVETTIVAAHLVFGGVMTRHRDLKIVLAHGGGGVAQLAGRWDRGYSRAASGLQDLTEKPSEIIRRLYVDSVVHSQAALQLMRSAFGDDQILFGSDWPFPMGADSVSSSFEGWSEGPLATARNSRRVFHRTAV